jgi:hypothetical protein
MESRRSSSSSSEAVIIIVRDKEEGRSKLFYTGERER